MHLELVLGNSPHAFESMQTFYNNTRGKRKCAWGRVGSVNKAVCPSRQDDKTGKGRRTITKPSPPGSVGAHYVVLFNPDKTQHCSPVYPKDKLRARQSLLDSLHSKASWGAHTSQWGQWTFIWTNDQLWNHQSMCFTSKSGLLSVLPKAPRVWFGPSNMLILLGASPALGDTAHQIQIRSHLCLLLASQRTLMLCLDSYSD